MIFDDKRYKPINIFWLFALLSITSLIYLVGTLELSAITILTVKFLIDIVAGWIAYKYIYIRWQIVLILVPLASYITMVKII